MLSYCPETDRVYHYCPVCQRAIYAENTEEVRTGEHEEYIFVHDQIPHDDSDIEALRYGIN